MKLKFERALPVAIDMVLVEPDGTLFLCFEKSGVMKAVTRTRFAAGERASTGAFSITSPDAEVLKEKEEKDERARHALVFVSEVAGEEKIAIVETFESISDAELAHTRVRLAINRHVAGRRRKAWWRTALLYAAAPLMLYTLGSAGVRFLNGHNGQIEAIDALMHMAQAGSTSNGLPSGLPALPGGIDGGSSFPTIPHGTIPEGAGSMLPAGADAASGVYPGAVVPGPAMPSPHAAPMPTRAKLPDMAKLSTIHFGLDNQSPARTLYVFADPDCPACRRFEPHMRDLARDFSVYVLPVAYQDGAAVPASAILCAHDPRQVWTSVMNTMRPAEAIYSGAACTRGNDGVKANMQAYDALGFTSTPRVFNGAGQVFAEGATAADIREQSSKLQQAQN